MKPKIPLATALTPDGSTMVLFKHDRDYTISVDREDLMLSREHESELELARLGCARIAEQRDARVLIGGLGLGYTLRQTLDMLQPGASVVVAELMPEVVRWNRDFLGELTNHPLRDPRVRVEICDVAAHMRSSPATYDAILLDIDNGTTAVTDRCNDRLYSRQGIELCMNALHAKGCLAVWAAAIDTRFERRLRQEHLHVRRFHVRAHRTSRSRSRCIWVASRQLRSLPDRACAAMPLREPMRSSDSGRDADRV